MKNVVNLFKKNIKVTSVSFVGNRIPIDPDTIRSLGSRLRMELLHYCEGGSMISVDLSANCEGWIYDPNGSGIQILGIRSQDPFSGSTDMSDQDPLAIRFTQVILIGGVDLLVRTSALFFHISGMTMNGRNWLKSVVWLGRYGPSRYAFYKSYGWSTG